MLDERITIRIDKETKKEIEKSAKKYAVSNTEIVRKLLQNRLAEIVRKPQMSPQQYKAYMTAIFNLKTALGAIETETKRIGNNVNQLTKKVNKSYDNGYINSKHLTNVETLTKELQRVSIALEKLSANVDKM